MDNLRREIIEIGLLYGLDLTGQLDLINNEESLLRFYDLIKLYKDPVSIIEKVAKDYISLEEVYKCEHIVENAFYLKNGEIFKNGDCVEIKAPFLKAKKGIIEEIDTLGSINLINSCSEIEKIPCSGINVKIKREGDSEYQQLHKYESTFFYKENHFVKNEIFLMQRKGETTWLKSFISCFFNSKAMEVTYEDNAGKQRRLWVDINTVVDYNFRKDER